jgi:predicted RNA binding protein YcfA (HicA-like mRNA interferase family)
MSKIPRLSGAEVITALSKAGFVVTRIKGSHHQLRHSDGRATTVPVHGNEPIGAGLMSKILRDCQLTREEFLALL